MKRIIMIQTAKYALTLVKESEEAVEIVNAFNAGTIKSLDETEDGTYSIVK